MVKLKRLLGALLVLALGIPVVYAAQNIIQKDSGGAVWQDGRVKAPFNEVQVGGAIFVDITDINSPGNTFVVSPKSGYIKDIYLSVDAKSTGATTVVTFLTRPETGGDINAGTFRNISSGSSPGGGPSDFHIQQSVMGWASAIHFPTSRRALGGATQVFNFITQGSVLEINTDGAGSNTVPAHLTIIIE